MEFRSWPYSFNSVNIFAVPLIDALSVVLINPEYVAPGVNPFNEVPILIPSFVN